MACTTLPADIQGCLNFSLIRGDSKEITLTFNDGDDNPIDLSGYAIKMEIRMGGHYSPPVSTKQPGQGMVVSGNALTIQFTPTDAVYKSSQSTWGYDIAFTSNDVTQHWIKGQITIIKSETETWK